MIPKTKFIQEHSQQPLVIMESLSTDSKTQPLPAGGRLTYYFFGCYKGVFLPGRGNKRTICPFVCFFLIQKGLDEFLSNAQGNLEEFGLQYKPCGIHSIYLVGNTVVNRAVTRGEGQPVWRPEPCVAWGSGPGLLWGHTAFRTARPAGRRGQHMPGRTFLGWMVSGHTSRVRSMWHRSREPYPLMQ